MIPPLAPPWTAVAGARTGRWCLALTALVLAGCGSGSTPTDHGVHDVTAKGVPLNSTRSQVQARLGPPLRVHADDLGTGPLTCIDYRDLDRAGTDLRQAIQHGADPGKAYYDLALVEHARKGVVCDHLHPAPVDDDPLAPWLRFFETTDVYGMVEE